MVKGGVLRHPEFLSADDIAEAQRLAQSAGNITGLYHMRSWLRAYDQAERQRVAIDEIVRVLIRAGDLETALALGDRMPPHSIRNGNPTTSPAAWR